MGTGRPTASRRPPDPVASDDASVLARVHWESLRVELELGQETAVLAAKTGVLPGRGTIIYEAPQLLTDPLKEAAPLETQQRSVEDHAVYRHVLKPTAHRMKCIVVPHVFPPARVVG